MSRAYLWGQIKQLYKTLSIDKENQIIKWPYGFTCVYRKEFNALKEKLEIQKKSIEDKQEDDTCLICYDKMQIPIKLDCGHKFDNHCIRRLIVIYNDDKCPLCRRIFNYKINKKNKRMHRKLKKELLEKLRNEYGRIYGPELQEVCLFLFEKDIQIEFINQLMFVLVTTEDNHYGYDWIDMDKDLIYVYDKSKPDRSDDNIIICSHPIKNP